MRARAVAADRWARERVWRERLGLVRVGKSAIGLRAAGGYQLSVDARPPGNCLHGRVLSAMEPRVCSAALLSMARTVGGSRRFALDRPASDGWHHFGVGPP